MRVRQASYAVWVALWCLVSDSNAALRTYNLTLHSGTKAPDGFSREVFLINGQSPGPLIEADEGDDLEISVKNDLSIDTAIHWHGILQQGTPEMDGTSGVTQYPIPPGGNFTYKFSVKDHYGFYWYHSHVRAYYNDGLRGPLLIRPSPSRSRPFEKLANNQHERDILLDAEKDATSILLYDWTHELSETVYAQYLKTGIFPNCVDSLLANGFGRVECLPEYMLQAGPRLGLGGMDQASSPMGSMSMEKRMDMHMTMGSSDTSSQMDGGMDMGMSSSSMAGMDMPSSTDSGMTASATGTMTGMAPSMTSLTPRGCMPPMMWKPGFNPSSLPPQTCSNTSSLLLHIPAPSARGWLALNLVNAGSVSRLRVSLDAHSMFVYAADGLYVNPQEVKVLQIEIGQRYSVMIHLDQQPDNYYLRFASYPDGDMQQVIEGQAIVSYDTSMMRSKMNMDIMVDPSNVWMLTNGSAENEASMLNTELLSPFVSQSPPMGPADQTHIFAINQTGLTTWTLNGAPYTEAKVPILQGNSSEGWMADTTIHVPYNSTIDIIMRIAVTSMDTMGHPMHLHGHKFWVLGSGTGSFPYKSATDAPESLINIQNPPYRDTANVPPSGWAVIRYVTDNPGAWIFHCHIQWHMLSGMAVVLVEGEDEFLALESRLNSSSTTNTAPTSHFSNGLAALAAAAAGLISLW